MASEIIERLIKIDASQGAASMRELYDVVEDAKKSIEDLDKSSDGYQRGLVDLKTAQKKYAEATRIAVANNENAAGSFNDLTGQLRVLKEQWKKTADEAVRADLTTQINDVKKQIDGMNESIGNFQHNVGNYKSHWEALGKTFNDTKGLLDANAKGFTSASNSVDILGKSFKAISTGNPFLFILTLILPLINTLSEELKKNKTFTDALKNAMEALNPVTDLLGKVVAFLADAFANAVKGITNFLKRIKVLKPTAEETNAVVDDTAKTMDKVAESTHKAAEAVEELTEEQKRANEVAAAINETYKKLADSEARLKKIHEETARLYGKDAAADVKAFWTETEAEIADVIEETNAQILAELGDLTAGLVPVKGKWDDFTDGLKANWAGYADAVAGITDSIADIIEAHTGEDGKNAGKIKALRIATATIDTISGAIGAYMNAVKSTPVPAVGIPLGIASAATVTAAGLANIAKIKSVKTGSGSADNTPTPAISAIQSAPLVAQNVAATTTITGASQEQRLDSLLEKQSQPVVLVWSDAERMAKYGESRQVETTFR